MTIEIQISQIETDVKSLKNDMDFIKDELTTIRMAVNKLLKQQHEGVLWETKGKDQRVKDTMKIENCPNCKSGLVDGHCFVCGYKHTVLGC
jgi:hypothetical protein